MKDLKMDVIAAQNKKAQIKLSDRIRDLNLGDEFIVRLNNKFNEDIISVESWDPV